MLKIQQVDCAHIYLKRRDTSTTTYSLQLLIGKFNLLLWGIGNDMENRAEVKTLY